ncbi:2-C-methyl-D-erythritol 4-phosphate cytidylyltransferase [Mycolicibacterium pulveris]|uniref:2-C-methyl-D-erythritol 4-phosphate cytidylyltransferase n=1 Tax=Mycolicibacterium pulveris TaxID=36813 RepID=A0A7I7UN69_MYCPV|nr:2-C-methyl-D-erythritol 4-phosphate cytidylyltransferase [Mycolicibacterium pulveris]
MSSTPYAVGVVLAAGLGSRVGADGNKAYLRVADRAMAAWSLDTLTQLTDVARVVLVYRQGERRLAEDTVSRELPTATVEFVEGGDSRHASEFNVLRYLAADIESGAIDVVLIHDAARPVAGADMFVTAVSVARQYGGAIPALPLPDVVNADDRIESPRHTATLVRVQTPQAFRAAPLLQAFRHADRERFEGTDTSSCVEAFTDLEVRTFPGEQLNIKVTYARDIAVAERLLADRVSSDPGAGSR